MNFSDKAISLLCGMEWPGNVREIRNFVDYAVVFSVGETIEEESVISWQNRRHKRPEISQGSVADIVRQVLDMNADNKLDFMEKEPVMGAMAACNYNKSAAARLLGVHRKVIERRLNPSVGE
jgi:two-component system response regulator HydG